MVMIQRGRDQLTDTLPMDGLAARGVEPAPSAFRLQAVQGLRVCGPRAANFSRVVGVSVAAESSGMESRVPPEGELGPAARLPAVS